jgi:transmembrane sensor
MNSRLNNNEDLERIRQQAAEWVLKADRGLTPEEQDSFTDWLAENPKHKEVYAQHAWGWDEFDRLAGLYEQHLFPVDPDLLEDKTSRWKPTRKMAYWAMPIAACFVLFFSLFFFSGNSTEPMKPTDTVPFERIQKRYLVDGSVIELNYGAEIETRYSPTERAIYVKSGEANFHVAKDPNRPFVVYVDDVRFKALGTVFNVRYGAKQVDLIVTEGRVQVIDAAKGEQKKLLEEHNLDGDTVVEKEHKAVVSLKPEKMEIHVQKMKAEDLKEELMWQPYLFDFSDEYLPIIIAEFNRRNRMQITIDDESLNNLKITSIFWSDNVEGFVRLMEANFNVKVEVKGEYELALCMNRDS